MLTIRQEGPRELSRRKARRKSYDDAQASATLGPPREDPLRTLSIYSPATKVQTPRSGHENPGLSDATREYIY